MNAVLSIFLLAGAPAAAASSTETYTYLSVAGPDTLDPAWAQDAPSLLVIRNVYETLVAREADGRMRPLLAREVPSRANGLISRDRRRYTFPIRRGVRFHDGSTLTPEDVRYSLMRFALTDRAGGPSSWLLEPLTGFSSTRDDAGRPRPEVYAALEKAVRVEGDSVVLRLVRPYEPLLSVLAAWGAVVPRQWAVERGEWDGGKASWTSFNDRKKEESRLLADANGTGPFKLERWDRAEAKVILARHEGYWREPAALSRVLIRAVPELSTRRLMLAAGDADAVAVNRASLGLFEGMEGVELIDGLEVPEVDPVLLFTFHLSTAGNPFIGSGRLDGDGIPPDFFSDEHVRRAFAHALDYDAISRGLYRGAARRADGFFPASLHSKASPAEAPPRFDLKETERELRRAWRGEAWRRGFKLTLAYNNGNTIRQALCEMLKRNLETLNPRIVVEVRAMDWPQFLDAMRAGRLPAYWIGWSAFFADPHAAAFSFMHSRGAYPTLQRWSSPEADQIIEQAAAADDSALRRKLYGLVAELAARELPHVHTVRAARARVQRRAVKGWTHEPFFPGSPDGVYFRALWKTSD